MDLNIVDIDILPGVAPKGSGPSPMGDLPSTAPQDLISKAQNLLDAGRLRILRHPNFALLSGVVASGKTIITAEIPFAAGTDGWNTWYNPHAVIEFAKHGKEYINMLLCHEAMHKAYGHNSKGWTNILSSQFGKSIVNMAEDAFINTTMRQYDPEAKFIKFPWWCVPPRQSCLNKSTVDILRMWKENNEILTGTTVDGHGWAAKIDPGIPEDARRRIEQELNSGQMRAEILKRAGATAQGFAPGSQESMLGKLMKPKLSWKDRIRAWLKTTKVPGSQFATWSRVSRRHIAQSMYMPGSVKYAGGKLVVMVDTSGSVWDLLARFFSEIQGLIAQCNPIEVHVLQVDAKVQSHTILRGNQMISSVERIPAKGGGGTVFTDVFPYIRERIGKVDGFIGFTDGYTFWPRNEDVYCPVLWIVTTPTIQAPQGATVYLDPSLIA